MALPARTRRSAAGAEQYVTDPPTGIRVGISLSGGGIRSAAFNLGALQALREQGVLDRTDYMTAVSGGNYVASALAISAAYGDPDQLDRQPYWAHGSPEERYLRLHTDYLAPGWVGRIWLWLSVIYGFLLNYLPFLLCAFLLGRLGGWMLNLWGAHLGEFTFHGLRMRQSEVTHVLVLAEGGCVLAALGLVAVRRLRDGGRRRNGYGESRSEPIARWLVTAAALCQACLILPALAAEYGAVNRLLLARLLASPHFFDSPAGRLQVAGVWLLAILLIAAVAVLLSRRLRARRTMLFLSSVAGGGLLLVPLLSSLEYSTRHGLRSRADLLGAGAALLVVLLMAVAVHNRRYSLHLLYRERLNSAFALHRTDGPQSVEGADGLIAEPLPYTQPIMFSDVGSRSVGSWCRVPRLVVCCAVNLTSDEVPAGRFAESFTFEHDVARSPIFGTVPTTRFEERTGPTGTQLTMPSIMAVSGAALSPLMGRFTYPPLRFLMALANIRLGVWVPNPRHADWQRRGTATGRHWWRRMSDRLRQGWLEPGALYVMREALGTLKSKHRFIYLTDGGHWENLGLVELLRRRCTHVISFDASSDRTGDGLDIGRAIALARSELSADIDLDPRPTMGDDTSLAADIAVRGTIRYPDSAHEARIVYARAALTADAGWDLHAYRRREPLFPHHPTSQQIFTDEQFEAYRSLGHHAGRRAVELLNPAPALLAPSPRNGQARDHDPADI